MRLSIARALYKGAPILVFDEATSALDGASERAVMDAIRAWPGAPTVILIAHRLSTIEAADSIHVIEGGRVVESGRHSDLLARNGAYARSVAIARSDDAEGPPAEGPSATMAAA